MVFTVICYPYCDNTEGSVPHVMITPAYLLRNTEGFHLFVPGHIPMQTVYLQYHSKNVWLEWLDLKTSPLRPKAHSPNSAVLAGSWWLPRRKQRKSLRSFASSQRGHYTAVLQGSDTAGSLHTPSQIPLSPAFTQASIHDRYLFSHAMSINFKRGTHVRSYGRPLVSLYPSAAGIHHCVDCRALKTTEKTPANFADLP